MDEEAPVHEALLDVLYDAARGLKLRVYRPSAATAAGKLPVLVYFHGGGYCLGTFEYPTTPAACASLPIDLPAVVLSADYCLAPKHRLPAAIDDGAARRRRRCRQPAPSRGSRNRETSPGSSCPASPPGSGANIAHHVAVRLGSPDDQPASGGQLAPVRIAGYIMLTAFFGGADRTPTESKPPANVFLTLELEAFHSTSFQSTSRWKPSTPG